MDWVGNSTVMSQLFQFFVGVRRPQDSRWGTADAAIKVPLSENPTL